MNTILSVWSQYFFEFSPEDAVDEFIKNGYRACELSDEHGRLLLERSFDVKKTGADFAAFLNDRNFSIPQGHLWLKIKICTDPESIDELFRWIDLYEAIGIRNMVLHCDTSFPDDVGREERIERNAVALRQVAEYVKGRDIVICLENLRSTIFPRNASDLLTVIEKIGSENFGICLDTGHLNLTEKDQRAFILAADDKLRALHIADNQGETDQHMMPFGKGTVDFCEVVRALREVDYDGLFNLEIPGESRIPLELRAAKLRYIQSCYDYLMRIE